MPFGSECLANGGVRFRLWAPKPSRVDLLLNGSLTPMERGEPGWFQLVSRKAAAGDQYQFVIDGGLHVPDPASRFQPHDVHGPSEVIDPKTFAWTDDGWRGRPWEEAAIYELHAGAFTPAGTFRGVEEKLDHLVKLGVTALELMPLSDFFGKRNWGYDGVLPFAPDSSYGRPEDLKRLVQAAHNRGLMVLLDVVYNHFGPEGNYLGAYAPQFFTARHKTPWGDAINFDGEDSRTVRDFFVHNALYWLEEFHLDGMRFDAVNTIKDDSRPDILTELAETIRKNFDGERHIHLVLENDDNAARYLKHEGNGRTAFYNAQWNDDIHHVCHVLASGETDGYYSDYADHPIELLGKCLTEGFVFQGQPSPFRDGKHRGEPSRDLPLTSFISFLQNHDQVGNRAFGERIGSYANADAVRAVLAILLLAPSPPMLFMGEEFAATTPFLFFCDFKAGLAKAVTEGRRGEFAKFAQFRDAATRDKIPDPNAEQTFLNSKLDWHSAHEGDHGSQLSFYSQLLALRQSEIVPLLRDSGGVPADRSFSTFKDHGLRVCYSMGARTLNLAANLGSEPQAFTSFNHPVIYSTFDVRNAIKMPGWSVVWHVTS